eukprot:CAMPEP_0198295084 /NCGR_PEP_ID=MMETSP1449-20131203/25748_1 /TAXON_ID=420275 /ORGANISM="Attheya septentrionalis, Strain CCMP2084" /LENGTH=434 /DNA_ID=CAMNT_0043995269 /DNA_START=315 /DNA_END=1619 /DNA_ORIENTATION=+
MDLEAALNGLKIDIGMIRNNNDSICGTMEVKQPKRKNIIPSDPEPLNHPKVVTQVLSQMIPLRTMYGVTNVYGILSTYSSWRFFRWVPEGEDIDKSLETTQTLENPYVSESPKKNTMDENIYQTPQKVQSELGEKKARNSPPTSPQPFRVSPGMEDDEEQENDSPSEIKTGTLYASEVITDGPRALGMLAWVLGEMNRSPINYVPAHQRDFLCVVQKDGLVGGYEKLIHTREHYKGRMPRLTNTSLYILEELGHRHQGRVYRAMSKNGNLCVLKYFVKSQYVLQDGKRAEADTGTVALKAVDYWNIAYERWLPPAAFGKWGGGDAIIMPDLEKMSVSVTREQVLPMLEETMRGRFFDKGIWHGDPAWRNVALVRTEAGDILKVAMIDLEPQRMIEKAEVSEWKEFVTMWAAFKGALDCDWTNFEMAETTGSLSA